MHKFLVAITLFAGIAAQAMPAVGDKSVFKFVVSNETQTAEYGYEISLTSFDAALNQYNRHTAMSLNGQEQVQDEWVSANDLMDDARVQSILENCAEVGGAKESVTLPAGTFDTCKLNVDNGAVYWVANVPFGFVKFSQPGNGYNMSAELQSYVLGQK